MKVIKILIITIIFVFLFIYLVIFFRNSNSFVAKIADYGEKKLKNIKKYSKNELQDIVNEINNSLPIIQEAGYSVNQIDIDLGMPSRIVIYFEMQKKISDDKKNSILKKIEDRDILHATLQTLFETEDFRNSIKVGDLKFQTISISIGTVTSIKFIFG